MSLVRVGTCHWHHGSQSEHARNGMTPSACCAINLPQNTDCFLYAFVRGVGQVIPCFRYPTDARLVTQDHLNTLRQLAQEREKNRDTAKYAILNVQFGVNALASYLSGNVQLQSYAAVSTRRAVEVRQRWTKAIKKECQVMLEHA